MKDTTFSFRIEDNELNEFRKNTQNGITPEKTATADVLRAFIRMYNTNYKFIRKTIATFTTNK